MARQPVPSKNRLKALVDNFIPQGGLAERAVKSGIWVTLINVSDRILQLAKLVVLAQLLTPADFGLMGIALLTLATLEQFSQLGLDTALIQHREERVDEYLNTAWGMKIVRGVAIATIAFVAAPAAGQFFNEPRAVELIQVIGLIPLIKGIQNPGVVYLRKNLEFHKQFLYVLSGTIADVSVAIIAALILQNVWALVFGSIAGAIVTFLASYVIHGYRPSLNFERELASELFGFGKWITLSGILIFLYSQGDDAFIGWFLGATALGFYQMAYRFSNAPATEITHIVSEVTFPTYSKLQEDIATLKNAYFKTLRITSIVSVPVATGIVLVAPSFTEAFLGSEWLPMVPVMRLLAIWGLLRSIGANIGPVFKSLGRPDVETKLQFLKVLVIAIPIYPVTAEFGLEGTAVVVVGSSLLVSFPLGNYLALQLIDGSVTEFLRILIFPILASVVMALAVLGLTQIIVLTNPLVEFTLMSIMGVAVYSVTILGLAKAYKYEAVEDLQMMLGEIKS